MATVAAAAAVVAAAAAAVGNLTAHIVRWTPLLEGSGVFYLVCIILAHQARIRVDDPTERKSVAAALAEASGSALVQVLGKNILIFRRAAPDSNVEERIEF